MSISNITPMKPKRFIDPNSSLQKQIAVLQDFIKDAPQNSRVATITPTLAEWILANCNTLNRRKKPKHITRYATEMKAGMWLLTGEAIIFSKAGALLDGQNRLAACIRAGVSFLTDVRFGISDEVFSALNSGKVRTPADTFYTAGVAHSSVVSAAIRWLMIYDSGNAKSRMSYSNTAELEYYSNLDQTKFELAVRRAVAVSKVIPQGALAAHLYMFEKKNSDAAEQFADDLKTKKRGGKSLLHHVNKVRETNFGRLPEVWINAMIVQAWNSYTKGKWTTAKDFRSFNASKDEFPEILS